LRIRRIWNITTPAQTCGEVNESLLFSNVAALP
jgi:hypothetical protein